MLRFLARIVFMGLAFAYLLPMLPGFEFHGNFLHALGAGVFFTILGWIVEIAAIAGSAFLTITTFGLALLVLIPAWILGFWLLPAVSLKLLADLLPSYMTIAGWAPAIWGGLVMLLIGVVTSEGTKRIRSKYTVIHTADGTS